MNKLQDQDLVNKIKKIEKSLDIFNDMAKNSLGFSKEQLRLLFDELKFTYDNKTSLTDYILNLLKHLLSISTAGYLGLLVAPDGLLRNISIAMNILMVTIIFCIVLIIVVIIKKIHFSNKISSILKARIDLISKIISEEQKLEEGSHEIKEKIIDFKNKM